MLAKCEIFSLRLLYVNIEQGEADALSVLQNNSVTINNIPYNL